MTSELIPWHFNDVIFDKECDVTKGTKTTLQSFTEKAHLWPFSPKRVKCQEALNPCPGTSWPWSAWYCRYHTVWALLSVLHPCSWISCSSLQFSGAAEQFPPGMVQTPESLRSVKIDRMSHRIPPDCWFPTPVICISTFLQKQMLIP